MPYTKQIKRETEREFKKFLVIQEKGNDEGSHMIVIEKLKLKVNVWKCYLESQLTT